MWLWKWWCCIVPFYTVLQNCLMWWQHTAGTGCGVVTTLLTCTLCSVLLLFLSWLQVTQRNRVYPFIGSVRAQAQALQLPNLLKADMEVRGEKGKT
jgi:hypothetical protein